MVRQKTRWLLVRIDGDTQHDDLNNTNDNERSSVLAELTKNDLSKVVKECILLCFGDAASGYTMDSQGTGRHHVV